jgi:hypothetical protein
VGEICTFEGLGGGEGDGFIEDDWQGKGWVLKTG